MPWPREPNRVPGQPIPSPTTAPLQPLFPHRFQLGFELLDALRQPAHLRLEVSERADARQNGADPLVDRVLPLIQRVARGFHDLAEPPLAGRFLRVRAR